MRRILIFLLGLQAAALGLMGHTYLQVLCEPGVEILIDGEVVGSSTWKDSGFHTGIPAGEYAVEARKEGYKPQKTTVSLRKSDVEVWTLEPFTPLRGKASKETAKSGIGALTVYSHPTECTVTLVPASGKEASWLKKGKRWTAKKLPAGKYTVKATRLGETLSYDIEIPAEGSVELIFDFRYDRGHLYDVKVAGD